MTKARKAIASGMLAMLTALAASGAEAASRDPRCPTLEKQLKRALKGCARRTAAVTEDLRITALRRCRATQLRRLAPGLARRGCATGGATSQPAAVRSTGTFRGFATGATQAGNLIHPEPGAPSETVFLSVSPAAQTVAAGGAVTYAITVERVGTPHEVFLAVSRGPEDVGFEVTLQGSSYVSASASTRSFTIAVPPTMAPGRYEFDVFGLTGESLYTEHAPYTLIVEAAPAPPPVSDTGTITVENSNLSVFNAGSYAVSAAQNQVGALFDDENNHLVDVEPAGDASLVYPRFPVLDDSGGWSVGSGRAYGNGGRIIVWAVLDSGRFVAAHLRLEADNTITPALLVAGDLGNPGVVLSTDQFDLQLSGNLPGSGPGALRGVIDGVPMFLEPNLSGNLWADRVVFEFDVRLFDD
jgi:hypothetical protein